MKIALLIGLTLTVVGCQTPGKDKEPFAEVDKPAKLFKEKGPDLPPSAWSPARRRMNARYFLMVGEYELMNNRPKESARYYEAAYNLDPNAFLAGKVIRSMAGYGEIAKALLMARKVVLIYPKNPDLHALYGRLLARIGQADDAVKEYNRAIDLDPSMVQAYLGLIEIYKYKQLPGRGLAVAKELVKVAPRSVDGWLILARMYLGTQRKKAALAPATRAYDLQPNLPESILMYALALELNGRSEKAVNLYERLYRINPSNEELIRRMVELYREIGGLEEALNLLQEVAAKQNPVSSGIRLQQTVILWELKRYAEAAKNLSILAKRHPASDRIRYMAALGEEKIGQTEKALEYYYMIPASSRFYAHARYRAANILRTAKRHDEALRLVREVLASGHKRATDFYSLGAAIYAAKKQPEEAVSLLEEGRKKFPDNVSLIFMSGVYYEKAGKIKQCIEVMKEVIRRDKNHHSAHNFLGYLYAERGEKLEEAERLITRAIELSPEDGYYHDSLGWVYYQQKKFKKALKLLLKANALAPNEGVILEHIADTYKAQNNLSEARRYYKQAVKGRMEERDRPRIEMKYKEVGNQKNG